MNKKLVKPALFTLCIILTTVSCKITNGEDETVSAPTVNITGATIGVSFAPQSGMTYANIFRQSCAASSFSGTVTTVNVGQIIPASTSSLPNSFIFYDAYVSSALYYRYYIRFYNGSYVYSDTSAVIRNTSGTGIAVLTVTSAALAYDCNNYTADYTLTLSTDTTVPDSKFTSVAVCISNGTKAKPLTLGATTASTTLSSAAAIDLQKKLPSGFFDTPLTVTGLIGVYPAKSSDKKYTEYYWTTPTTSVTVNRTVTDSDGTAHAAAAETSFTVPSPITTDNGFDYTGSRAAVSLTTDQSAVFDSTPDLQ
jgi:hypothetical protein